MILSPRPFRRATRKHARGEEYSLIRACRNRLYVSKKGIGSKSAPQAPSGTVVLSVRRPRLICPHCVAPRRNSSTIMPKVL